MPLSELPEIALPFEASRPLSSPSHRHVILPYAALPDDSCLHVLQNLTLPHLEQLLGMLSLSHVDEGDADSLIPPHERVVARLWELNPLSPAWAAIDSSSDLPCAWMTLCHWSAGADQVRMDDPTLLPLDMEDAQALHTILQPWFAQDGFALDIVHPNRWRIQGAALEQLQAASLDRVVLRDVTPWLPSAQTARTLHRLHSEVQMLLYTHAFNSERTEHGMQPINAFWIHGTGQLSPAQRQQPRPPVHVFTPLRKAALRQHWPAWKQAWLQADAGVLADLCQHIAAGGSASLTLCGERHARSYTTGQHSWVQKIRNMLRPTRFADLYQDL